MKMLLTLLAFCCITGLSAGDRALDQNEVGALLQTLTQTPQRTWLPAGTIRAKYLEFRAGEETAYESEELFRFDGNRYYWDIQLLDPPADVIEPQAERPDHQSNKHRIFAYDGQAYTRYYKSSDYAVVVMNQQSGGTQWYGPFTAGVIPWGLGTFTLQKLSARSPAGVDYMDNGQRRIRLTLAPAGEDMPFETVVVLDPDKQYVPCSYTLHTAAAMIQHRYDDYRRIGQTWVPFIVTVERFDLRTQNPTLVSYEDWRFLSVDAAVPTSPFAATFANGTIVELQPSGQMKSFMYHAAEGVDIHRLLEEKIMTLSAQHTTKPNCAASAVTHIARRFSKQVPVVQAAAAPSSDAQGVPLTSLAAVKDSLESAGLHCVAVKTDIESLAGFKNYGVILHFPGVKHYVVLDRIENGEAWTVDLTSRKFYWKRPIAELLADWTEGVALLVSDGPILLSGRVEFLDGEQLGKIFGGSQTGYSCTDLIQEAQDILCPEPVGGLCGGAYYRIQERYGCREDYYGTTCTGQKWLGYEYSYCVNNPLNPTECELSGRPYNRHIRACQ